MVKVNFYTFSKNENSTKRVSGDGLELDCLFVEPTDIISPRIALAHKNPTKYNYMHIATFDRYYFIDNWAWSGGRWVASCHVDVLASWKSEIGNSRQYVERSAAEYDGGLVDSLYPTKSKPSVSVSSADNPYRANLDEGCYVVGVVNGDSGAQGAVSYYTFSNTQFRAFCSSMMSNANWLYNEQLDAEGKFVEFSQDLVKAIVNPFQYVVSCMWFPFTSFVGGGVGSVKYGWYNFGGNANGLSSNAVSHRFTLSLPKHPQNSRGEYLNGAPFTRYTFSWPCYGQFPIDANIVSNWSYINVVSHVDAASGVGILRVYGPGDNTPTILTTQARIGVPIQLAQSSANPFNMAVSTVSEYVGKIMGGIAESIADAVSAGMSRLQISGSNGSTAAYAYKPQLICEHYRVADDDPVHLGRPLMSDRRIGELPGYIRCINSEIECAATSGEIERIKQYLNGGFYYE
mgnify:CR=1 FL=1